MELFGYEAGGPPGLTERSRETVDGASLRDVSYASPKGGDVPAYLVVPDGEGPFAAVMFLHWGAGDRTEFLSESLLLARAGAVSLLIDAPHVRPGWQPFAFGTDPENERDFYVQTVIELRRAVDVLASFDFVDPGRVGYVGHSLGATFGGALAGVEERVGAFVLMGGLGRLSGLPHLPRAKVRRYAEVFSGFHPQELVEDAAPGSVFFQFGRYDRHVAEDAARAYVEAAQEAEAKWYLTSHEFNDEESRRDRLAWLGRKLGLAAPSAG